MRFNLLLSCLLAVIAGASLSCGRVQLGIANAPVGSENNLEPRNSTPSAVKELIRKVMLPEDVIRGYWFVYPHGNKAGYRVLIQRDAQTWTELWSSGEVITSMVEGRALVNKVHGTRLLRLGDANADVQVEAFIPDRSSRNKLALFRVRKHGLPDRWNVLSVVYVIK
jgi:hypothetical protein